MEPVHRNPRWQLFGRIWNGMAVRFWNAIQDQNHLTSEQLSTIGKSERVLYLSHLITKKANEYES